MNNNTVNKPLDYYKIIKTLSLLTPILYIVFVIVFRKFWFTGSLIERVVYLTIYVIFALYVFRFYFSKNSINFFTVIFVMCALAQLCVILTSILRDNLRYNSILESLIFYIIFTLLYTLCAIKSLRKINKNKLITVTLIVSIIFYSVKIMYFFVLRWHDLGYALSYALFHIPQILFLVAMFIFTQKFTVFVNTPKPRDSKVVFTPEQALKVLKAKFETGAITEEEYIAQRTAIIKKL